MGDQKMMKKFLGSALNLRAGKSLLCACFVVLAACGADDEATKGAEPKANIDLVVKGSSQHIAKATAVSDAQLDRADSNDNDWLSYGHGYSEQRYSGLDQINKDNLDQIGLAWTIDVGTKRGIQGTPIVADGIMYQTGPWSVIWAVDVRKGEIIWQFDPKVDRAVAPILCCGVVNRGVAIYEGAVFIGTLDGRLISVDAVTGEQNWSVQTYDRETEQFLSITGAPRIVNGNVLIGNGGAEYYARGFVTAYNAKTGEQAWRFYTVPGNPAEPFEHPDLAEAAKTWTGEWWKQGGGGTAWESMVHDPELNLVYIGVGNGSHWDRLIRSPEGGDNLYLSSIVALDADTGEYQWHFQTTPGDTWDYTATQSIILADLVIDGKLRKTLMQAPKNGYFYVIDRTNGEFISGDNYVYVNWSLGLDENGRPIEREGARYEDGRTHWIAPSSHGGHNWHPMAFNPNTGLVYVPAVKDTGPYTHKAGGYGSESDDIHQSSGMNISVDNRLYREQVIDPKAQPPGVHVGRLIAWNPISQEEAWGVDMAGYYNSGLLTTASGLLLQGESTGQLAIRDAATGELLKRFDTRAGSISAPVTYTVDGEQYISMAVGWGGGQGQIHKKTDRLYPGTLYTWKLGGTAKAPATLPPENKPYTTVTTEATDVQIGNGASHFYSVCMACHRLGLGGGVIPDLTRSNDAIFNFYDKILLDGLFASQGMPNFGERFTADEVEDIKAYVLFVAQQLREGKSLHEVTVLTAKLQKIADDANQAPQ